MCFIRHQRRYTCSWRGCPHFRAIEWLHVVDIRWAFGAADAGGGPRRCRWILLRERVIQVPPMAYSRIDISQTKQEVIGKHHRPPCAAGFEQHRLSCSLDRHRCCTACRPFLGPVQGIPQFHPTRSCPPAASRASCALPGPRSESGRTWAGRSGQGRPRWCSPSGALGLDMHPRAHTYTHTRARAQTIHRIPLPRRRHTLFQVFYAPRS